MEELKYSTPPSTHESPDTHIAFCSAQNAVWIADIAGSNKFLKWNFTLLLSRFLQARRQLSIMQKQFGTSTVICTYSLLAPKSTINAHTDTYTSHRFLLIFRNINIDAL
jgi:hypothetical protein